MCDIRWTVRKLFFWKLKQREIKLGERTVLMGVLNVTPDSFSDGGKYSDPDRAFARAVELEEQGADIVDIGAESTKPGSARISAAEEMRRLIPVLKRLKDALGVPISVDTYKAEVAERALELGAEIINDPSGLTFEPQLARAVSNHNGGLILNHMRGRPETWAKLGPMPDPIGTIARDLEATISRARRVGIDKTRIVIDPGLGFGKRKEQNAVILGKLWELAGLDLPIMVGPSRKSFLAHPDPEETKFATAAAVVAAVLAGAHIVRVHDVREMRAATDVADEILRARSE
jgi:dihydropteroate synthase